MVYLHVCVPCPCCPGLKCCIASAGIYAVSHHVSLLLTWESQLQLHRPFFFFSFILIFVMAKVVYILTAVDGPPSPSISYFWMIAIPGRWAESQSGLFVSRMGKVFGILSFNLYFFIWSVYRVQPPVIVRISYYIVDDVWIFRFSSYEFQVPYINGNDCLLSWSWILLEVFILFYCFCFSFLLFWTEVFLCDSVLFLVLVSA